MDINDSQKNMSGGESDPCSDAIERAKVLTQAGRWELALKELHGALALDPDSAVAHFIASCCLWELKRYDEGQREAIHCLRLSPDCAPAYYVLANIAFEQEKHKVGLRHIQKAIELDPDDADNYATQSALLLNCDRYDQALQSARTALSMEPDNDIALQIQTLALTKLGKHDEAERSAVAALSGNPDSFLSWYQRGAQLFAQGRLEESKQAYLQALMIEPENIDAQDGLMKTITANGSFFAPFWKWTIFLHRFHPRTRAAILIGLYVLVRTLGAIASATPSIKPAVIPILAAWVLFCLYTWTAQPLFRLSVRKGWIR